MATLLRGPADPEQFRVKRYGTRWYRDPLPADSKWPAMSDPVPAVSTIKKAWNKPFKKKTRTGLVVPLDAYRAAEYVQNNLAQLSSMHPEQAFTLVATAPDLDLAKAANRGTAVHSVIEALAMGQRLAPELHDDAVRPFVPACEQFVHEWRPVWRMTEFVVINRTLGFAGTADALVELPGDCPMCGHPFGVTVVDWKSRGSKHGAYEEEVCQLGGYASGEYVVVTNAAGDLERIEPPDVQHGAIVSITADDGYQLYPVEIDQARHAFLGLFETWRIGRDGRSVARQAVGSPLRRPDQEQSYVDESTADRAVPQGSVQQAGDASPDNTADQPTDETKRHASPPASVAGARRPPGEPRAEIDAAVQQRENDADHRPPMLNAVSDSEQQNDSATSDTEQVGTVTQPSVQGGTPDLTLDIAHLRSRVVAIVEAAAGRPLPVRWPEATPTFKPGGAPITVEHLPAITEWCDAVEREMRLPFPPPAPSELAAAVPPPPQAPSEPRRNPRVDAEEWAAKGRALLSLLHDEQLARACAATANCDDAVMTRERYLALQAVVTQVSEPAGVLLGYWSGDGCEVRAVRDIEKALLAQMPTEGTITKATKLEALQRGKRIAKRIGMPAPKNYDDLCDNLLLAACVAVGHGINAEIDRQAPG